MYKEPFKNTGLNSLSRNPYLNAKKTNSRYLESYVPSDLGYSDITGYYDSMDDALDGTSLVNISAIESKRFPIMLETPTNWYNTQSMILKDASIGTDKGKLPKSECIC